MLKISPALIPHNPTGLIKYKQERLRKYLEHAAMVTLRAGVNASPSFKNPLRKDAYRFHQWLGLTLKLLQKKSFVLLCREEMTQLSTVLEGGNYLGHSAGSGMTDRLNLVTGLPEKMPPRRERSSERSSK